MGGTHGRGTDKNAFPEHVIYPLPCVPAPSGGAFQTELTADFPLYIYEKKHAKFCLRIYGLPSLQTPYYGLKLYRNAHEYIRQNRG